MSDVQKKRNEDKAKRDGYRNCATMKVNGMKDFSVDPRAHVVPTVGGGFVEAVIWVSDLELEDMGK